MDCTQNYQGDDNRKEKILYKDKLGLTFRGNSSIAEAAQKSAQIFPYLGPTLEFQLGLKSVILQN